jgi:hypothetical protein
MQVYSKERIVPKVLALSTVYNALKTIDAFNGAAVNVNHVNQIWAKGS